MASTAAITTTVQKIATTNPANRKILEMTRLDEQLEVYDSVIDAVKSFIQNGRRMLWRRMEGALLQTK